MNVHAREAQPQISVIIPNYDGAALLPVCLESLRHQTYKGTVEVIVVDDASRDDSVSVIREKFPEVSLLCMPRNRGFAAVANKGIKAARGRLIVLLNNDVEADEGFLEQMDLAFQRHPEAGWIAAKIRLFDRRDVLHSAGDFYTRSGVPVNRGVWERDLGQYDGSLEVFGACAGAAGYRREMLDAVAEDGLVFDEDLVMYCEDVDLNFRAQIMGFRCAFEPRAIVYHRLSATGGGVNASYHCGRNFILLVAKDIPGPVLRRNWHRILSAQAGYALESIRHFNEAAARARLRGQLAAIPRLPLMLRKRRRVQAAWKGEDGRIERLLLP